MALLFKFVTCKSDATQQLNMRTDTRLIRALSTALAQMSQSGISAQRIEELVKQRVFDRLSRCSNPKDINLRALDRVLGLTNPSKAKKRFIYAQDSTTTVEQIVKKYGIVTEDDLHLMVEPETEVDTTVKSMVLNRMANPRFGRVTLMQQNDGVAAGSLLELVIFITTYDLDRIGRFPIFALGSLQKVKQTPKSRALTHVFYAYKRDRVLHLKHMHAYAAFPRNAVFLGRLIGE